MFKFMAIPGAFYNAMAALVAKDFRRMIGPTPPPFRGRSRRGPVRAPGKGRRVTVNNSGWWRRHALIRPIPITERMLMRHGWYRRKLRKQGVAIDPTAKNSMVLR